MSSAAAKPCPFNIEPRSERMRCFSERLFLPRFPVLVAAKSLLQAAGLFPDRRARILPLSKKFRTDCFRAACTVGRLVIARLSILTTRISSKDAALSRLFPCFNGLAKLFACLAAPSVPDKKYRRQRNCPFVGQSPRLKP